MKKADLEKHTREYYKSIGWLDIRRNVKAEGKMKKLNNFVAALNPDTELTAAELKELAGILLLKLKGREAILEDKNPKEKPQKSLLAFKAIADEVFGDYKVLTSLDEATLMDDVLLLCSQHKSHALEFAKILNNLNRNAGPSAFQRLRKDIPAAIPEPDKLLNFYKLAFEKASHSITFEDYLLLHENLVKASIQIDPETLFGIDILHVRNIRALIEGMLPLFKAANWDISPYLGLAYQSGERSAELHKTIAALFDMQLEANLRKSLVDFLFKYPNLPVSVILKAAEQAQNEAVSAEVNKAIAAFAAMNLEEAVHTPLLNAMLSNPKASYAGVVQVAEQFKASNNNNALTEKDIAAIGQFGEPLLRLMQKLSASKQSSAAESSASLLKPENLALVIQNAPCVRSILQACLYLEKLDKLDQNNFDKLFKNPRSAHLIVMSLYGKEQCEAATDTALIAEIEKDSKSLRDEARALHLSQAVQPKQTEELKRIRQKLNFFAQDGGRLDKFSEQLMKEAILAAPSLAQQETVVAEERSMSPGV
ncbi:hypothetical protein Lbir_2872 [Legionella birminghamensis]|uniref:Uncharacterized protein n=1 Tax=Legionella birminghamensis TaxID=28083 RepID=A0A378I736_9GAMM|nr:hypothetical protein [Legionella birminghamensis]KTC68270.1 hypothetical protein Lbir_2872 [Legionella birminghamensis]STX31017.1 Uncharacterised protein [Legionella birminghamensis]